MVLHVYNFKKKKKRNMLPFLKVKNATASFAEPQSNIFQKLHLYKYIDLTRVKKRVQQPFNTYILSKINKQYCYNSSNKFNRRVDDFQKILFQNFSPNNIPSVHYLNFQITCKQVQLTIYLSTMNVIRYFCFNSMKV